MSLLLIVCACFGLDRRGGITKYKNGTAYTATGRFHVSALPPPWKSPKSLLKQMVYENDPLQATIVVDALCGAKYDEAPLDRLAEELFQRFHKPKIASAKMFALDGRTAIRMEGAGDVDGVPLRMAVAVMKKDFCVYDFVYFAPSATYARGLGDFERYLDGFGTD